MKVDLFDFELPPDLIALRPTSPRDAARQLIVDDVGGLTDDVVSNLASHLEPGDVLVFNDTRVIPARLSGRRTGRGHAEPAIEVTLHQKQSGTSWLAFARPGRKLQTGDTITFTEQFSATVVSKNQGGEIELAFTTPDAGLDDAIARHGIMPLPPYIASRRETDDRDRNDYQTMFAARDGAVAAPTASLHFTPDLMRSVSARGISKEVITLHVGAGTFLPVKADDTEQHTMHAEWGEVTADVAGRLNAARASGHRVIAVGTTALRLLESAVDEAAVVRPWSGSTDIFITPGYRFRAVDGLMTNFHLPRSTLFMLVSAFCGLDRMKAAYQHAIEHGYRFYSYGDSSLLWPSS